MKKTKYAGILRGIFGKSRFPSISRIITDLGTIRLRKAGGKKFAFLVSLVLLIAIVFASASVYRVYQGWQIAYAEREKITKEIKFWEDVVSRHKDYRDAYFTLALLHYQLEDNDKVKFYIQKSLALDPGFKEGRELEKIIGDK